MGGAVSAAPVFAGLLLGAAGLLLYRQQGAVAAPGGAEVAPSEDIGIMDTLKETVGLWHAPAQYAPAIAAAESANGLPRRLLERLLWQESRYRADIISGARRSSAGALGIAQFMPATAAEMGIDPLDAFASIDAAATYLARLYRRFASWEMALAAYNWGQGNVARKGLAAAPAETRAYYSEILADLGDLGDVA